MKHSGQDLTHSNSQVLGFISHQIVVRVDESFALLEMQKRRGFTKTDEFVVSYVEEMLRRTREEAERGMFSPRIIGISKFIANMAKEPARILPCVKRIELLCETLEETRHGKKSRFQFNWLPVVTTALGAFPWILGAFSLIAKATPTYLPSVQHITAMAAMGLSFVALRTTKKKNTLIGLITAALWLVLALARLAWPFLHRLHLG